MSPLHLTTQLKKSVKFSTHTPNTACTLFKGIGVATGGTVGAATLTGASTGNYVYTDLTRKGVDENTALKVAGVNAVGDAVGTALPISYGLKGSGGLVGDAALSIGGATGLNTGMQYWPR